jgi:hypothetical protein
MADRGIKITVPGKQTSSTDMRDFVLHSKQMQRVLRTQDSGSNSISFVGTPSQTHRQATVTHNLGYIPFYQVYGQWFYNGAGGGTIGYDNITNPAADPWGLMYSSTAIDTTTLYVDVWLSAGIGGGETARLDFIYFVGRDPI